MYFILPTRVNLNQPHFKWSVAHMSSGYCMDREAEDQLAKQWDRRGEKKTETQASYDSCKSEIMTTYVFLNKKNKDITMKQILLFLIYR